MLKLPKIPQEWRRAFAVVALLGLLAAGPGAFLLLRQPTQAEAAWFDTRWGFRQGITLTISSSASNITNLQTLITVNTSALISASKLQSSCQDLRFTSSAGIPLPYYIDSGCNTTTTKVWVQVDFVPKNTTTYLLYMYYGNSVAAAGSDQSTLYNFNLLNGLVGYWTMNDTSWVNDCSTATITDSSVNNNKGRSCSASTGPTTPVAGNFSTAISLNGTNQYISVPNSTPLQNITGDMTVSAWLKPGATQNTNTDILSKHSPGGFLIEQNTSTANQYYFAWDTTGSSGYTCLTTYFNLTASVWQHLVISKSGAVASYFINGTLVGSCTGTSGTIVNNTLPMMIGNWAFNVSGGRVWNGLYDDFRIYNRALSASEITQLYNYTGSILTTASSTIVTSTAFATEEVGTAPLIYYKFDEGTGTTANNSGRGGTGEVGTLNGFSSPATATSGWQLEDQCVTGKCLRSNGSTNYVSMPYQNIGTSVTYEIWFNAATLDATQRNLFSFMANLIRISNTQVLWYPNTALSSTSINYALNTDTWNHLAITQTGTTYSLYINGKLVSTGTTASSIAVSTTNDSSQVGAYLTTSNLAATYDEFKVFSYVRTAAQIQVDYNLGASAITGKSSTGFLNNGLVGYWKMDETSGNPVDATGNGVTLTNNGTATFTIGKFGNAGTFNGSTQYFSTATSIPAVSTVSFWVNPVSTSDNFINLSSSVYLKSTSGTLALTGATGSIYVNGAPSTTLAASSWSLVTVTIPAGVTASQIEVGRANSAVAGNGTKIDEVRLYNRLLTAGEISQLATWAPGPVSYWDFNENTGSVVSDSSGYTNTGAWVGTLGNQWKAGKYGSSGNFNGSDNYVSSTTNYGTGASLAQFTEQAWFKTTVASGHVIIGLENLQTGTSSTLQDRAVYIGTDGKIYFYFFDGSTHYVISPSTYNDGNWHFVSATNNGTTGSLYIDGVLVNSGAGAGYVSYTTSYWRIGSYRATALTNGSDGYFVGQIDEVKVYNYARTPAQISDDMRGTGSSLTTLSTVGGSTAIGQPATPIGLWHFDKTYGTTSSNAGSGGSVLNGTLTNMASPATSTSGWQAASSGLCKLNGCLAFDGSNDYVNFGSSTIAEPTTVSLTAWVKTTSTGTTTTANTIFDKTRGTSNGSAYLFDVGGDISAHAGKLEFGLYNGSTWTTVYSNKSVNDGTWHHVAATYDTQNMMIYVDGKLDSTLAATVAISYNGTQSLYLGAYNNAATSFFNGSIDEPHLYNFALTPDQIRLDYNFSGSLTGGGVGGVNESASDLTDGAGNPPVGYWNFNEYTGSTVNDRSGNGITGTWAGSGTQHWSPGKFGAAGKFNGVDDYVNATSTTAINNLGIMTVEAWVKPAGWGGGTIGRIADKGSSEGNGWSFSAANDGGTLYNAASLAMYRKFSVTDGYFSSPTNSMSLNTWTHVAVVYNDGSSANTPTFYINGVQQVTTVNTTPSGTAADDTTSPFKIGNRQDGIRGFNGLIDEVKIYNYARTQAQIAYDYNRGTPLAWYKFDECQGTTINDSSGNGLTNTLTVGAGGTQTAPGTCTTASTAWGNGAIGKFNSSINLDGTDDYVSCTDASCGGPTKLDIGTNTMSFSAWVKTTTTASQQMVIEKGDSSGTNGSYRLILNNGSTAGLVTAQVTNASNTTATVNSVSRIVAGNWYYLTATYDGANVRLYINGKLENTTALTGTVKDDTCDFRIGVQGNTSCSNLVNYFSGQIDDVRIYNYALSITQIRKLMNDGGAMFYGPVTGTP